MMNYKNNNNNYNINKDLIQLRLFNKKMKLKLVGAH